MRIHEERTVIMRRTILHPNPLDEDASLIIDTNPSYYVAF
jgi:hypothetical protein